jgi:6-phosphogluconate dehydrogenase (decarboxylating)
MDVSTIEEAQKLLESGKIEVTSIVSDYPIEGEFKKLLEDRGIHYLDIGTEILLDDLSESGSEYIQ